MNRVAPITNSTESEDRNGHFYDISPDACTEQHSAAVNSDQIVDDNNIFDGDNSSHGEDDETTRVSYVNYEQAENELSEDVKEGVQKHMIYRTCGVVKFEDLLDTLKDYKMEGYQPRPGTVIEVIDASMEWNLAIVSNTYASPDEDAVAFGDLLDNVAIHEKANDGNYHHHQKGIKKNLVLEMDTQETYCCTAITQDTDRTGMLSHGNDPDEVRPAKAHILEPM